MKQIRKRLTYANVMSTIAVFLVLGGATALAAGQLGKNSVGSKQLKKNAVVAAKIKNSSVTSAKIADGAVTGAKVQDGSLTGSDINASTLGTVPSATKATTATTAVKLSRITVVKADFAVGATVGANGKATATCPAGTQAIAGGVRDDPANNEGEIVTSRPTIGAQGTPETGESFDGWRGSVTNNSTTALSSTVWAVCIG